MTTSDVVSDQHNDDALQRGASLEASRLLALAPFLHRPFLPERISFLPKDSREAKGGGTTCKIFPIAEVWDYVQLLTTHAFGQWSVSDVKTHTFDDRIVVILKLTICDVSMWGVGEEMLKGTTGFIDENATTSAWAQAFKRACSYFGLGLYLYFMKKGKDVAYDPIAKRIDKSKEELRQLISQMYKNAESKGWLELSYGSPAVDLMDLQRYINEPFPCTIVDFRAHSVVSDSDGKGGGTCTAVPFVRVWYYIHKLNNIAYGHWAIEEEPVITSTSLKVIVSLKINIFGCSMIGIGEEFWTETRRDKGSKPIAVLRENAVENAWAQAFKRCLQAFGLGLSLRFLPEREGVPYEYGRVANPLVLAQELYHGAGLLSATEKQMRSLHKLCRALTRETPEQTSLTSLDAQALIVELTNEYKSPSASSVS